MTRVHARKGSTAVEVGITLPVFVLLLLGIVEWGWAFPRQVTLEHIARDACRSGALTKEVATATAAARSRAEQRLVEDGFVLDQVEILVSTDTAPTAGRTMTVALAQPYQALLGAVPTPIDLRASATMRMEDQ